MCKYFGISLPRTGTVSLMYAMRELGFSAIHYLPMQDYEYEINRHRFINEYPISIQYPDLDEKYSGSKFIYTDRPVDSWLESFELHWKRTGHLKVADWDYYNYYVFGTLIFDKAHFRERFLMHRNKVLKYFENRQDLLILKWPYTQDTWSCLANFTKQPRVPQRLFPHANGSYSQGNPWCPRDDVRRL